MILQDYDPLAHNMTEFVSFCERLERVEMHEGKSTPVNSRKNNPPKNNNSKRPNQNQRTGSKTGQTCMLHGANCGHDTEHCRVLGAQEKRMKATYSAQTPSKKS